MLSSCLACKGCRLYLDMHIFIGQKLSHTEKFLGAITVSRQKFFLWPMSQYVMSHSVRNGEETSYSTSCKTTRFRKDSLDMTFLIFSSHTKLHQLESNMYRMKCFPTFINRYEEPCKAACLTFLIVRYDFCYRVQTARINLERKHITFHRHKLSQNSCWNV